MPTVLELGLEQRRRYVEKARRSLAQSTVTGEDPSVRARLLDRVRHAVRAADLKTRFGVQRVIIFGSLAQPEWFAPNSDVDIAVEGLRAADYWDAWRLLEDAIRERQVDLVDLETVSAGLRRSIERHGIEV